MIDVYVSTSSNRLIIIHPSGVEELIEYTYPDSFTYHECDVHQIVIVWGGLWNAVTTVQIRAISKAFENSSSQDDHSWGRSPST